MADNLYRSVQGVPYAPVATHLPAGVRSLILELHAHLSPRLGRWVILVRLAVAAGCFAGGLFCARLLVECLLGDPGACPCVLSSAPSPEVLALGLPLLCVASFLTLAKTGLAGTLGVRPASTLQTGECCAMLAEGRFEPGGFDEVEPS